jgi:transketolase
MSIPSRTRQAENNRESEGREHVDQITADDAVNETAEPGGLATVQIDQSDIVEQSINTIRLLAVDAVEKANSGHPGMPMGTAPMAYVLWTQFLKHNPADPHWIDRDRFILSAGHGSMLLYGLLHLTGYSDMSMEELKNFRQWESRTPGHPENFLADGIETTTGPLGQGFANAVGFAIAEKYLAAKFNRPDFPIVDHYTYGICSDGDLMEGISHEAASLAGHLGLGKLIFLYDDNDISIDGSTDLSFTEDVGRRFQAYNWHVQHIDNGNDVSAVADALESARGEETKPSLIIVRTEIGYGSPNKQGTASAHGEPLGEDEVRLAKRNLGWPEDKTFYVPDAVYQHMRTSALERGAAAQKDWGDMWSAYEEAHSELSAEYTSWLEQKPADGWDDDIPVFDAGEKLATRAAGGKVLNAIADKVGFLIGGSADLTPSNKTDIKGRDDFQKATPGGGYLRFGVREHAMASACNGIALHEGLRPYCGTFLIFSDYMRPAVRLSALMKVPVVYVFTHDSIGLGEDGPTHQPVEHLMSLRAIPNMTVIRPCDANETAEAWKLAVAHPDGPIALALSRQGVPTLDRTKYAPASGLHRGGYTLFDSDGDPQIILIGTGSEVQHVLAAAEALQAEGIAARAVSMPSWELFEKQPTSYRERVLPSSVTRRVSVEAGAAFGWERYVGREGAIIGLNRFGASAPGAVNMERLGFTAENVTLIARGLL